jgi:SNF2 family DNA or RNA helicase
MMHFTNENWLEMCEFFCDHDPKLVYYKQGHFVKCLGLKRQARPYQAYIVWFMFKMKTTGVHGCILAEGVGMGKTFETMLYCWIQNVIIAAGQDMRKSRAESATPEMRRKHLTPGTKENPQPENARCPSQSMWGVQCPCIKGSLSATLLKLINVGPVLIAVPPKLIPQWKEEFEETFDPNQLQLKSLRMQLFIEHHEHLDYSFAKADESTEKQFYYEGEKNCCTRFVVLTSANVSLISRIKNALFYKSRIQGRSLWSALFWDEFHETRTLTTQHCEWFQNEMELRPECETYPSMIGLSGTPIVKTVKDILCVVKPLQDLTWLDPTDEKYPSCSKNIESLAKRYTDLLKEGEKLRQTALAEKRQLTRDEKTSEMEKRKAYSEDLNAALLPIMSFRRAADSWFGRPMVDLPKLIAKFVMVDTREEYLPYIQTLATRAKERADAAWKQKLDKWTRDGRKQPQPVRNDSSLRADATFVQVRFCASFPAFAQILQTATEAGEEISLLANEIRSLSLYTTTDEKHIDTTWYGKYFSQLVEGSQKLQELDKFLTEMKTRSKLDSRQEKMIIGCSGPPVVAFLRLVSAHFLLPC